MNIEFCVEQLIKSKGLNIRQAAALCGLPYSTIHPIVKNRQTRVDLKTLAALASGLGVGVGDLFHAAPEPAGGQPEGAQP